MENIFYLCFFSLRFSLYFSFIHLTNVSQALVSLHNLSTYHSFTKKSNNVQFGIIEIAVRNYYVYHPHTIMHAYNTKHIYINLYQFHYCCSMWPTNVFYSLVSVHVLTEIGAILCILALIFPLISSFLFLNLIFAVHRK